METIKKKYTRKFQVELMITRNTLLAIALFGCLVSCKSSNQNSNTSATNTYWQRSGGLANVIRAVKDSINSHGNQNFCIISHQSHNDGRFAIFWLYHNETKLKYYRFYGDSLILRSVNINKSEVRWLNDFLVEGSLGEINGPCESKFSKSFGIEVDLVQGDSSDTLQFSSDCIDRIYSQRRNYRNLIHLMKIFNSMR